MAIYRKILPAPIGSSPTTWTDLPGLSPITIQSGQPGFSFIATLSIGGLTIPTLPSQWQVSFRILQGSKVIAQSYMGSGNGPFQPQVVLVGVGDVAATGQTEDIHAQWTTYNVDALIKEASSFSIVWDERLGD
jgi:hypothetical protein